MTEPIDDEKRLKALHILADGVRSAVDSLPPQEACAYLGYTLTAFAALLNAMKTEVGVQDGHLEVIQEDAPGWNHLAKRKHHWRKQLYVKGCNMTAAQVVGFAGLNKMTDEEVAQDRDLPAEAVIEASAYYHTFRALINFESVVEWQILDKYRGPDPLADREGA